MGPRVRGPTVRGLRVWGVVFMIQVTNAEIEDSFDRLKVGNKRSSATLEVEEKTVTAFHEVHIKP